MPGQDPTPYTSHLPYTMWEGMTLAHLCVHYFFKSKAGEHDGLEDSASQTIYAEQPMFYIFNFMTE